MAIKLNLTELRTITNKSIELNSELNTQLNEMISTLNAICANVQVTELTEANKNLVESIDLIIRGFESNLPQVTEFLNRQVTSYEKTNEEAQGELNNLVSSINSTFELY